MPTGYIVSQYSQIETEGDSIGNSTLGSPTLIISPDSDPANAPQYGEWTVAASNFRISEYGVSGMQQSNLQTGNTIYFFSQGDQGVILPDEVLSVEFEDIGIGGQAGNTIAVRVNIDPTWQMPAGNYNIQVDIDGIAEPLITQDAGNFKVILTNSLMPDPMHYEHWAGIRQSSGGRDGSVTYPNWQTENQGSNTPIYYSTGGITPGGGSVFAGLMTGTWTDYGHEQYLQYEANGLQNPNAITNCTITPTNSPVVNGGLSIDGSTWATECVEWSAASGTWLNQVWDGENPIGGLPLYFEWEITPNPGKTVAASDFYILQSDKTGINTRGYGPGCSNPTDMGQQVIVGINSTQGTAGEQQSGGLGEGEVIYDEFGNEIEGVLYDYISYNESKGQILDLSKCTGFGAYGFLAYGPHTLNTWMPVAGYVPATTQSWTIEDTLGDSNTGYVSFTGLEWNEDHPCWNAEPDTDGCYPNNAIYVSSEYPSYSSESLAGTGNFWDDIFEPDTSPNAGPGSVVTYRRFNSVMLWHLSDEGLGLPESGWFGAIDDPGGLGTVGVHCGNTNFMHGRTLDEYTANVEAHSPTLMGDITGKGLLRITSEGAGTYNPNPSGEQANFSDAFEVGYTFTPCGCIKGDVGGYQGSVLYDNDLSLGEEAPFINGVYNVGPTYANMHGGGEALNVYQQPPNRIDGLVDRNQTTIDMWYFQPNGQAGFVDIFRAYGRTVELVGDGDDGNSTINPNNINTFPQDQDFLQWPFWNGNDETNLGYSGAAGDNEDNPGGETDVPSQYQNYGSGDIISEDGFLEGGNRDCWLNGLMNYGFDAGEFAGSTSGYESMNTPSAVPWYSWTYKIHRSPSLTPFIPTGPEYGTGAFRITAGWAENGIADNYVEIRNTTTPGSPDNTLKVRYYISPHYSHELEQGWNTYNKAIYIQINGTAQDIQGFGGILEESQPPPSYDFEIHDNHNNTDDTRIVTITRPLNLTSSEAVYDQRVERGGFADQRDVYSFSGKVPYNEKTVIALVKIEAGEGKHFQEIPYLSKDTTNKNISLRLISKTSNTSYAFHLCYKNTKNIYKRDELNINLVCNEVTTVVDTRDIHKISYGKDIVSDSGEKRRICVHGNPGTEFELLLTKATLSTLKSDQDGYDEFSDNVIEVAEENILSASTYNSSVDLTTGENFKQISGKLNQSGRYYFNQTFPSSTEETQYKIHIKSNTFSGSMLDWDIEDGWTDYYTKTIYQRLNPTLSIKATVGSNYALTHFNGSSTGLSDGDDHTYSYVGRPNLTGVEYTRKTGAKDSFTVSYTINGAGGKQFTANRLPKFSKKLEYNGENTPASVIDTPAGFIIQSDWTNTNPNNNGGTEVTITKVRSVLSADGGVANGICTISFKVIIEKWGLKSVTMDLDLDKVLTTT